MLIYTFGYTGQTPEFLRAVSDQVDGCVVDVRYSPRSRNPTWTRKRLQEALGDRYAWIKGFGNINYRTGGPILLCDFDEGFNELQLVLASGRSPVLLCACGEPAGCHRMDVAHRLADRLGVPLSTMWDTACARPLNLSLAEYERWLWDTMNPWVELDVTDQWTELVAAYRRSGGLCALCRQPVDLTTPAGPSQPTIDHIVPQSCDGGDQRSNLQLAHRGCNSRKCAR